MFAQFSVHSLVIALTPSLVICLSLCLLPDRAGSASRAGTVSIHLICFKSLVFGPAPTHRTCPELRDREGMVGWMEDGWTEDGWMEDGWMDG